jgi:hypothetical protein
MKTSKIGEIIFGKFKTEIHASEEVKKFLKKEKLSQSILIPQPYIWYEVELFEIIDENGDGKPDDKFGKNFKIIYISENESFRELEQQAIHLSQTAIKNTKLKYATLKI